MTGICDIEAVDEVFCVFRKDYDAILIIYLMTVKCDGLSVNYHDANFANSVQNLNLFLFSISLFIRLGFWGFGVLG